MPGDRIQDEPTPDSGAARRGIQSVDVALRVLSAFAKSEGPLTLKALGALTGMPASKLHRYLSSFVTAGLVEQRQRSGSYDLGPFAMELGLAALSRSDFVNRAAAGLEELVDTVGTTAMLSVWGNSGPTVVRWERSRNHVVTALGLGATLPLLRSATGRIFLANLPAEIVADLLAREQAARPRDRYDVPELIAAVRTAGYASVDGAFIPGLYAVAAPILNWQDHAEAVVTLISTTPDLVDPDGPAVKSLLAFCRANSVRALHPG